MICHLPVIQIVFADGDKKKKKKKETLKHPSLVFKESDQLLLRSLHSVRKLSKQI